MAYRGTYNKVMKIIKDMDKDIYICDTGCGDGNVVKLLRETGFVNIFYCDIENRFKGTAIMDISKAIGYPDDFFDLVISIDVIEHIENKYVYLREANRILKKDGVFILATPNIYNFYNKIYFILKDRFIEFPLEPVHTNPFFIWDIKKLFEIEEIRYNRGFIPLLRISFINNKTFGQTIILKLRKNG